MNEIGVTPHIVEAVLGHVSGSKGGIAGVYNLAGYRKETRIALERWADQVMAWVEGRDSNIATLRTA